MVFKNIKDFVKEWKENIKNIINTLEKKPSLAVIQVGDNEASNRYVRNKLKDCEEVGIEAKLFKYPEEITDIELISELNIIEDKYTGVFIQLPLPPHLQGIEELIDPEKDVDGFTEGSLFKPCTPSGIIKYLDYCDFPIEGADIVVIGKSKIVGRPLAEMLLDRGATVTVCHSRTKNIWKFIDVADLVVCAVGKPQFLNCWSIGVPVVDVGINFDENGKLVGDCFNTKDREVTPVPGGVGLLTRCALLENVLKTVY